MVEEAHTVSPAKEHRHRHAANPRPGSVTPAAFASHRGGPGSPKLSPKPGLRAGISSTGKKGPEAPPTPSPAPNLTLVELHEGCQPQHPWVLAEPRGGGTGQPPSCTEEPQHQGILGAV